MNGEMGHKIMKVIEQNRWNKNTYSMVEEQDLIIATRELQYSFMVTCWNEMKVRME